MLKRKSHKRPTERKAMMTTQDDEYIPSEKEQDDDNEETSNYYFMAKDQGEKECLKSIINKDEWFLDRGCSKHMVEI